MPPDGELVPGAAASSVAAALNVRAAPPAQSRRHVQSRATTSQAESSGSLGEAPRQPRHVTSTLPSISDAVLAFRPASLGPITTPASAAGPGLGQRRGSSRPPRGTRIHAEGSGSVSTRSHPRPGFPSRGARGSKTNGRPQRAHNGPLVTSTGHVFGGQLTGEIPHTPQPGIASTLHGSATEFRPGTTPTPSRPNPNASNRNRPHPPRLPSSAPVRKRRFSKSSAADIATRTHEDISTGNYECPICVNEITPHSKVWTCHTCWTVFHLTCVKRWAKNEGSTQTQQAPADGELPPLRQWRCPGCNLPKELLPSQYECWCGKEVDPKPYPGLPPHSCGQSCGRTRRLPKKCPHPCELVCHAGPCPPCSHIGPKQPCFCGREEASRRCVDTDYETGWSCAKECGTLLSCGEHRCARECHGGPCGPCQSPISARCYCGKETRQLPCSNRSVARDSSLSNDAWTGLFSCDTPCERPFDCSHHRCSRSCHPQTLSPAHCPASPDVVTHCPCGKTALAALTPIRRTSCTSSIPTCTLPCSKPLPCGHLCQQRCHSDSCRPCTATTSLTCRCGRVSYRSVCHQGQPEFWCARICRTTLNCGHHTCSSRCCPGEKAASLRISSASKRKSRPFGSIAAAAAPLTSTELYESEHICLRSCDRPLRCTNHTCPLLCHRGPCPSCREAIFTEITCHCGRTVLQPPLPCGTQPPLCRFPCERRKACGHPQTAHTCHSDAEECPRCPFLVEKGCLCGKNRLRNQQCWLESVRCGEICDRLLRCGSHHCRQGCHAPGACEDVGPKGCEQRCGKEKHCGHACEEACHAPGVCREGQACTARVLATCQCQRVRVEMKCGATRTIEGKGKAVLPCDEECSRLERNRNLALALDVDPDRDDEFVPYGKETLAMVESQGIKWAQGIERMMRVFGLDEAEKRLRFPVMKPGQRSFVHSLADDYGLDSQSLDPEGIRSVVIYKTPRFVSNPGKSLGQCINLRAAIAAASTTASTSTTTHGTTSMASSGGLSTGANLSIPPYNGFLMSGLRFGLTIAEVSAAFHPSFTSLAPTLTFAIDFLPSEEIIVKPTSNPTITSRAIEATLRQLKPALTKINTTLQPALATTMQLCRVDTSLNVLQREADHAGPANDSDPTGVSSGSGWSQVAAKAAVRGARAPARTAFGTGGGYTVLGNGREVIEERMRAREEQKERQRKEKLARQQVAESWEDVDEEVEAKAEAKAEAEVEAEVGAEVKVDAEGAAKVEGDVTVEAKAKAEATAEAEVEVDTKAEAGAEAGVEIEIEGKKQNPAETLPFDAEP